jgi:peroxiredoxin family protein
MDGRTYDSSRCDTTADAAADENAADTEKMAIIAASGDLAKAWPVMILATTRVAYGVDVTVFFTFWGLCPMPVIKVSRAIKPMATGQTVEVIASERGALSDIPA